MIIQINNFIDSWEIRDKVYQDWTEKLNNANLGSQPYVLACVPFFTSNNYNNEEVYFAHFFKAGLNLYGAPIIDAQVICWRSVARDDNYITTLNFPIDFIKPQNLWYYEYDGKTERSKLDKINTQFEMEQKLKEINANNINQHPIIFRERILMKFRKLLIKKHDYLEKTDDFI